MHYEIVEGSEYLEFKEPTVYMCNHQATLDMLALGGSLPQRCVVTAKKEVKFIPVMGQVMWAAKNIFIDRKNRENAILALDKVAERMKAEQLSVHCFPEGTRSMQRDKTMLPFKKGFFHMAKKFKFPIVAIVVSTYYPVYDEKEKIFERGTVQIKGPKY